MNFIFSIFQQISFFFMRLFAPFRNIQFLLVRLRSFNPITMLRNSAMLTQIKGFFQRIGYMFGQFFRVPGPMKSFFQRIGLSRGDSKDIPPKAVETASFVTYPKPRRGRAIDTDEGEQLTQIHLVDKASGNRTITHLGMTTGRSEVDVLLHNAAHPPVRLGFRQANPLQAGSQIVLQHLAGRVDVVVDKQAVMRREVPIHHNSTVMIGEKPYSLELYEGDGGELPTYTRVQAGWFTSIGPRRQVNEDAIGIYQHRDAYMFVIADGVGGGEAGEIISEFAVKYMLATFHRNIQYNLAWSDILRRAMEKVNAEVWHFSRNSGIGKAGTTLTLVVIQQWEAFIAHAGDSRLYHYSNKKFRQVSDEHSRPLNEDDTNYLDDYSDSNTILTQAIGKAATIKPQITTLRLQPGDKLVLCTDGLTDYVDEAEIRRLIVDLEADQAAEDLVELANQRHATDNVSAVVIDTLSHGMFWDAWKAENDDRVYAGDVRLRPLKVASTDEDPMTHYERVTPVSVLNVILFLIGLVVILRLLL